MPDRAPLRAGPDKEEQRPAVAQASAVPQPVLPREVLRPREIETLELLFSGMTRDQVAHALGVAVNTVDRRIQLAYRLLRVDSIMRAAWALGYMRLPSNRDPVADRIRLLRTADVTAFTDASDLVYREDVLRIVEGRG